MIYIAHPYTDKSDTVMHERFKRAEEYTAQLLTSGKTAYSPIVHCHEMAKVYDMPKHFAFWRAHCLNMLRLADEAHVLQMNGWDISEGVLSEIQFARNYGIPIEYIKIDNN